MHATGYAAPQIYPKIGTTSKRMIRGECRLSIQEGFKSAMQFWRYPSQRRTWLGLFLEAFIRWVLMRREYLMPVNVAAVMTRPHLGNPLYERMFGVSNEEFLLETNWMQLLFARYSEA